VTVLDASALLAFLSAEPGSEIVAQVLHGSFISAANASECATVLVRRGLPAAPLFEQLRLHQVDVVSVMEVDALAAAELYPAGAPLGLSLGDRLCLALALRLKARALTADSAWSALDIGVDIQLIR